MAGQGDILLKHESNLHHFCTIEEYDYDSSIQSGECNFPFVIEAMKQIVIMKRGFTMKKLAIAVGVVAAALGISITAYALTLDAKNTLKPQASSSAPVFALPALEQGSRGIGACDGTACANVVDEDGNYIHRNAYIGDLDKKVTAGEMTEQERENAIQAYIQEHINCRIQLSSSASSGNNVVDEHACCR